MKRFGILMIVSVLSLGLWSHPVVRAATSQLVGNSGFESGQSPWQESTANGARLITSRRPHTGSFSAWLCGYNVCNDQLRQTVTLPSGIAQVILSYWVYIDTQETLGSACHDRFQSQIRTSGGAAIVTAQSACNGNATNSWASQSVDLTAALTTSQGQQVQVYFQGTTDASLPSDFFVDDVALTVTTNSTGTGTPPPTPTNTPTPPSTSQVSSDPFAAPTPGQHQTEVEPDTFAYGGVEVSAFQVGRISNGGSTDIGWATWSNGSWHHGVLPGLTRNATPAGPYDRASDPSVAHDAAHGVWLISSLALVNTSSGGASGVAVVVSRSRDGLTWSNPVIVSSAGGDFDKNWIVCDTTATSRFYGHCYVEWDDPSRGDLVRMSTSTDGGQTWSAPLSPGGNPSALGGQPVVQPNGTVIVPSANGYESAIIAFRSTDGGATWGNLVTISTVSVHQVAGGLRSGPLPSAEIDANGKVYVVWQDCRFEVSCTANDIIMSTSTDGVTWSALTRIPIDPIGSVVDHFIPGLAVNAATSGSTAQLGLTYYFYPSTGCSASTCQLKVGFVSSINGGASWSTARQLAGPMALGWLPSTSQGPMVGDYISTSFVTGNAQPVYAVALAPSGTTLNEAMNAQQLSASGGSVATTNTAAPTGGNIPPIAADRAAKDRVTKRR